MSDHVVSIGYLILANECPRHFARLTRALRALKGARLFVHIDKKADAAPFKAAVADPRVRFLEDRVRVRWGDFSVVEATLALMTAAAGSGLDRLCLLSGVDYPVRSAEYIVRFFDAHRGTEFISMVPMPNDRVEKPLTRLTRYHLPTRRSVASPPARSAFSIASCDVTMQGVEGIDTT